MRRLTIILAVLLFLVSCATVSDIPIARPVPPAYEPAPEGSTIPVAVMNNTIKMTGYIEELEIYADALEGLLK